MLSSSSCCYPTEYLRDKGSSTCRGEDDEDEQLIPALHSHPTASIWNRTHGEGDESHQKVMVQLERIKETTK